MNSRVQYTEQGQPFLTPEIELKKGEVILVRGPGFNLLGLRDRDGQPTYIPTLLQVVDTETGDIHPALKKLGLEKIAAQWNMPESMARSIAKSAEIMPLILAVDREVNHVEKDDLAEYPVPSDGLPVEWIAVTAPPWSGKTSMILDLFRIAAVEGTTTHVLAQDLDDMSGQSLTRTLAWIDQEVLSGRINLGDQIDFFEKVGQRMADVAKEKVEIKKPNLREILAQGRENYKNIGPDHVVCQNFYHEGQIQRKKIVLVDLPGIQYENGVITEKRPLDLFDCLFLAMPTVVLPRPMPALPFFGPSILATKFDEELDYHLKEWLCVKERVLSAADKHKPRFSDQEIVQRVDGMNLRVSNNTMEDLLGTNYHGKKFVAFTG